MIDAARLPRVAALGRVSARADFRYGVRADGGAGATRGAGAVVWRAASPLVLGAGAGVLAAGGAGRDDAPADRPVVVRGGSAALVA